MTEGAGTEAIPRRLSPSEGEGVPREGVKQELLPLPSPPPQGLHEPYGPWTAPGGTWLALPTLARPPTAPSDSQALQGAQSPSIGLARWAEWIRAAIAPERSRDPERGLPTVRARMAAQRAGS